jgi:NAD(P)-dependent dehydrogenase (short-subunit alcohol dehydrogenase family)
MLKELFDLTGKVALVTGGSKGLGLAMARGFAEAGADIIICSRKQAELEAALPQILDGTKSRGKWFVVDLTKREDAEQCRDERARDRRQDL